MILNKQTLVIADANSEKRLKADSTDPFFLTTVDGLIANPFGCTMRNALHLLFKENIERIYVVVENKELTPLSTVLKENGVRDSLLQTISLAPGVDGDVEKWLDGELDVQMNIRKSVEVIKGHPFLPSTIEVAGWMYRGDELMKITL